MYDLSGKVVIVTGASKGIGAGIARAMGAAGASVAVNYAASKEGADRIVDEIVGSGGDAIAIQGDVSDSRDVKRIFAETVERFGALDVLVNNAAFFKRQPLEEITEELFHRHFNVNVLGAILMIQEAVNHFRAGGCVINIGSTIVLTAPPLVSLYASTKAATDMLTQVLSKELGARKIRVNSIWPGVTQTEGNRIDTMPEAAIEQIKQRTALHRIGAPSDVAPAAVFLASNEASWITGAMLNISGGYGA